MPYDVFLSYASADIALARELYNNLVNEGFKVWFDKTRLAPGFNWYKEIEQGCENSRVIIPVMTPAWKNSDWTKYETYGSEAVIPVLLEGSWAEVTTPPLERFQAEIIYFNQQGETDWTRLFSAIRRISDSKMPEKAKHLTHMHYRANEYFTGREKELIYIHEELHTKPKAGLTTGRVRVIAAMGGAGKTTLVRQYVEKFWRCYSQMFWVDCRNGLEREFAHIHDFLFPERKDIGMKDADKAASALYELNENISRLLILDNADNMEEVVIDWIPKTGACHTLITSRFGAFGGAIKTIHIFLLEKEPTIEFFKKRTGRDICGQELASCETLAEKLGYLPLALEQAAAYIEQQGEYFGFSDYLLLYEQAIIDLLDIKTTGSTEYPVSVFATWKSTVAKLSPVGRAILHLSSYLATVPIPVDQIITASDTIFENSFRFNGGVSLKQRVSNKAVWMRSELAKLKAYSMIQYNGQSFTLHPLLQVAEIYSDSPIERENSLDQAVFYLQKIAPQPSWEGDCRKYWSLANDLLWSQIKLHVSKIEQIRSDFGISTKSNLLQYQIVNAYASHKEFNISLQQCNRLIESVRLNGDSQDFSYQQVLKSLAYLQKENRMYKEALQSFTELHQLRAEQYGIEAPETIYVKHNIAIILNLMGRSDEAEKIIREVLKIQKDKLGEDNYETIISIHNLGWWLFSKEDRWKEAEPLFRHAYEYWRKNIGVGILDTRIAGSNLANLLNKKGNYSDAEQLQSELLQSTEAILGRDHLDCLSLKHDLAFYVYNNGKPEEALELISDIVKGYRQCLPQNHSSILSALYDMGFLLQSLKRYSEAETFLREALAGYEKIKGCEDKDTLRIVRNLADLMDATNRHEESKLLRLRILDSSRNKKEITPLELRLAAMDFYNSGEYILAESFLVRVLSEGFEISGTHCHLARICILTDRLQEAHHHIDLSWQARAEAPPYVMPRILWFKITLAFLTGGDATNYIRQIKTTLQKEDAIMEWTMQPVLDHIKSQITEHQHSLLSAMLYALRDKQNLDKLNEFSEWIVAKPEEIT